MSVAALAGKTLVVSLVALLTVGVAERTIGYGAGDTVAAALVVPPPEELVRNFELDQVPELVGHLIESGATEKP